MFWISKDLIMAKKKTENRHYVNNKEFLAAMTEYRTARVAAEEAGETPPRVSNYIGECFVKIANHLAYKSNFVNYTFREEMILDGIENCITYINNFDPAKSSNPFAYFTQITYYAFLRRIQKEKKQLDAKYRYIQSLDLQTMMDELAADGGSSEYLEYMKRQIEEADKQNEKFANEGKNIPKRRPKYFNDKEALAVAKEKIDALKDAP